MAQAKVVDVAALANIGKATHHVKDTRERDQFFNSVLRWSGQQAINMGLTAWRDNNALKRQAQSEVGDVTGKINLLEGVSNDIRNLNETVSNSVMSNIDKSIDKQKKVFRLPFGGKREKKISEGINEQKNAENILNKYSVSVDGYVQKLNKNKLLVIHNRGVGKDGETYHATWGDHMSAQDKIFNNYAASGLLDKFAITDQNGEIVFHKGIIDRVMWGDGNPNGPVALDDEVLIDLFNNYNKGIIPGQKVGGKGKLEYSPDELLGRGSADDLNLVKWKDLPWAQMDESGAGAAISIDTRKNNRGKGAHDSKYGWTDDYENEERIRIQNEILHGENAWSENKFGSWLFNGSVLTEDGKQDTQINPVDHFINEAPDWFSMDHDGHDFTDNIKLSELKKLELEKIAKKYNLGDATSVEDLTDQDALAAYKEWESGIKEEIKLMGPELYSNGQFQNWTIEKFVDEGKFSYLDQWKLNPNNPDNKTSDYTGKWASLPWIKGGIKYDKLSKEERDDFTIVNAILNNQQRIKIGHDTYIRNDKNEYTLSHSTSTGTKMKLEGGTPMNKTTMIQEFGGIFSGMNDDYKW